MIKESIVLAVVAASASGAAYHYGSPETGATAARVSGKARIWIEQDGVPVEPDGTTWRLAARPFTFVVEMPKDDGVLMSVSERPDAYDAIVEGRLPPEPAGWSGTGMAEYDHNLEHEVVDHWFWGAHYLHHERDHSRFDKGGVVLGQKRLRGRRTVERIRTYLENTEFEDSVTREIGDLAGGTLYVVFFAPKDDFEPDVERSLPMRLEIEP